MKRINKLTFTANIVFGVGMVSGVIGLFYVPYSRIFMSIAIAYFIISGLIPLLGKILFGKKGEPIV
ncbi:hypothetical protein KSD_57320 [Ktedonobacter sp. SOSP1-85]|nr:hypothetical protein KSD_57320 [Ktedonobacter sp. SOSP1-85]